MSSDEKRTVLRLLLAWKVDKEQRWLSEQARSGWHVSAVRVFGYRLEAGPPREVAYRLDVGPQRGDEAEYLGIFRDAGWEHLGRRGMWHLFRKPVTGGEVPEIHTDPQSHVAMYRRVVVLGAVMMVAMLLQIPGGLSRVDGSPLRWTLLGLPALLAAVFAYATVRTLLVINRIRKQGS